MCLFAETARLAVFGFITANTIIPIVLIHQPAFINGFGW